jgi:hypothetical protein
MMSVTILCQCKACNGRHEFFVPGTSQAFDPQCDLAYTCPKTSRRTILAPEDEWTLSEFATHVDDVIVRRMPK